MSHLTYGSSMQSRTSAGGNSEGLSTFTCKQRVADVKLINPCRIMHVVSTPAPTSGLVGVHIHTRACGRFV